MTGGTKTDISPKDRDKAKAWLRVMLVMLLLSPPAYLFIQAGRQIDLDRSLLEAIHRNDTNTVAFLLSAGADANARDSPKDTRPMLRQIVDRLRGIPAPAGESALLVHLALTPDKDRLGVSIASPENPRIVQALLDHHADPNVMGSDYQDTPLMRAAHLGKNATLRLLLKRGADIHLRDRQGTDALQYAAGSGSAESVRLMLDAGADVNTRDSVQNTPLMNAISEGDIETIRLLIARGADVNAKDSAQDSVRIYAARTHSPPIIALLKSAGAK